MSEGMPSISWNALQPGGGGLPSNVPSSGGAQDDQISRLISSIASPIKQSDISAAITPIAGPRVPAMPSAYTTPITPSGNAPMDQRPVVGKHNAKMQGIGNAFIGASNALSNVITKEAQVKQGNIRDAAQKVITAQQAIDEAQTQHDMLTQSGDTAGAAKFQSVIDENTKARDAIFADPKMRKALAKGFDFNYVDPSENKTDEHAAVQQALANAKTAQERKVAIQQLRQQQNATAGSAAGAAFAKAQPRGLAANTQAQAKVQMAMAQQKIQAQVAKDYMNFRASVYRSDRMVDASQMRQIGAGMIAQARMKFSELQMNQRFAQAEHMLGERYQNDLKLITARANAARTLADDVYKDKESDPSTMYTKTLKASSTYQNNALLDGNTVVALIQKRDAIYKGGAQGSEAKNDPDGYQAFNVQINLAQQAYKNDVDQAATFKHSADLLYKTFGFNATGENNAGSGDSGQSSNGQSDAAGGNSDFTDPINWLNSDDSSDSSDSAQ